MARVLRTSDYLKTLYQTAISYPAPVNLSYLWTFGFHALVCLGIQFVTGIFLAMHYVADDSLAFLSVEHIMRDVNYGWFLRYAHANGASMFFIAVYVHMFRGIYYGSCIYPREYLWIIGVIIFFLMIVTAFLGYVLPWGQMSFWAATVITNLLSAIPKYGQDVVVWIWGGFSVSNATLNRFFSFHFLLPFLILGLVILHVIVLHEVKSNNPIGVAFWVDRGTFYPLTYVKDFYALIFFFFFYAFFVFFFPNMLGHTDNYIPADPMVTPAHIVPEWYFLPFYAILRSIPDKLLGVLALFLAIIVLGFLPVLFNMAHTRSMSFRPATRMFFFFLVVFCFELGALGSAPAEYPYVAVSQLCSFCFFACFFFFFPFFIRLDNLVWSRGFFFEKFQKNMRRLNRIHLFSFFYLGKRRRNFYKGQSYRLYFFFQLFGTVQGFFFVKKAKKFSFFFRKLARRFRRFLALQNWRLKKTPILAGALAEEVMREPVYSEQREKIDFDLSRKKLLKKTKKLKKRRELKLGLDWRKKREIEDYRLARWFLPRRWDSDVKLLEAFSTCRRIFITKRYKIYVSKEGRKVLKKKKKLENRVYRWKRALMLSTKIKYGRSIKLKDKEKI